MRLLIRDAGSVMAEGEGESGEVMLATAVHPTGVSPLVKREQDQVSNQESDDECSSLDSSGEGGGSMVHQDTTRDQQTKQHINGMMSLGGLQNLPGLQALAALQSSGPGLVPTAPMPPPPPPPPTHINNQLINTPLNLSVNASANLNTSNLLSATASAAVAAAAAAAVGQQQQVLGPHHQPPPPPPAHTMPQLILASGQLVQGIQGAQLLIPTSQGIATQTILTIPLNAVTNNQMVNMAMSNGQVMTTTLANLAHQYGNQPNSGSSPTQGGIGPQLTNPLPHLLTNGHHHHHPHHQQQQQQQQQHLLNTAYQQQQACQPTHNTQQRSPLGSQYSSNSNQSCAKSPPSAASRGGSPPNGVTNGGSSGGGASSPLNTISRLAASNSDLTITTTSAPKHQQQQPQNQPPPPAQQQPPPPPQLQSHHYQHSPTPLDLMDEPNQPMISESRGNTVDGINLDEIKEFAKAFKLRRLSLGLTQTQVGQALSITEGPAYSQSAICSALATQMYCAAQLASQQQSMFEKLDITPKSAQKIKPVLEQWMKEAEERYKSGQNHLTEFIGVEPSKKRKRRTSFTPQALELLNAHFERNTHPSGTEITTLAHQLGYEREVIRIWFCNKRQALKNTVRMMSKSCT